MTDKSHVGMGYSLCPICYKKHGEVVLLDKRLLNSLERDNFMGFDLCPEHKAMVPEYAALVEVKNGGPNTTPENAQPTGRTVHIKREAWPRIFNVPAPEAFGYVDKEAFDKLESMQVAAKSQEAADMLARVPSANDEGDEA